MHRGLAVLLGLALMTGIAGARLWVEAPATVPACDNASDAELGCDLTECSGYGTAGQWADEIQVRFRMPHPELGGPWLVSYVAFFMSGTETHRVILRDPGSKASPTGAPPGAILDASRLFTPAYPSWPPADWTFVGLGGSPPYPEYLVTGENQALMLGTEILPGDAIGLSTTPSDGDGWGYFEGAWHDDSANGSMTAAVRIGLTDLGLSGTDLSTWSSVKALFR